MGGSEFTLAVVQDLLNPTGAPQKTPGPPLIKLLGPPRSHLTPIGVLFHIDGAIARKMSPLLSIFHQP